MTKKELIDAMAEMSDDAEIKTREVFNDMDGITITKDWCVTRIECDKKKNKIVLI